MKKIMISVMALFLSAGCAAGNASASAGSPSLRVQDGQLQYQDESGNWNAVANQDAVEEALKEPAEQTAAPEASKTPEVEESSSSSQQTQSAAVIQGAAGEKGEKGDKGDIGNTGPAGRAGLAGKDGADGTIVSIGAEGELLIDGKGTGYYLVKGNPSVPSSEPTQVPTPTTTPTSKPTPTPEPTPDSGTVFSVEVRRHSGFVVISWEGSNYNGYNVTISGETSRTFWVSSTEVSISEDTFTDGETYLITVKSYDGHGEASYTFRKESVELEAPENLNYETGDDGSLTITWDPVDHADSYEVDIGSEKQAVTTNRITFPHVSNGTYYVYLTAKSSDPDYTLSQPSSVQVYQQSISGIIDLATPSNVQVKYDSSSNSITITWDPVEHADHYGVTFEYSPYSSSYIVYFPSITIKNTDFSNDYCVITAYPDDSSKYASSSTGVNLDPIIYPTPGPTSDPTDMNDFSQG
jgi:hypothetical protein